MMITEINDLLSNEIKEIHISDFMNIPLIKGEKGDTGEQGIQGEKGDKPIVGVDYYTEIEKNEFKNAIVKDSKEDIQKHAANKIEEYDNNATERIKEYNTNASNKINEYDENANKLLNKLLGAEAEIKKDIEKKVDKIEGKELSSNDFTDGYKQKLDNLENYDDTQIKKYISDIEEEQIIKDTEQDCKILELQNKKTEIEKELKEMQEDFYQNSIRGQASGEYIHVEDSSNCRAKIGIGGNHEQETRSGKNKIDLAKCQVKTLNGVTSTYNKENNSITFNGTCTLDSTSFYITENGQNDYDNNLLIKKNYTLLEQYIRGSVNGYALFRCSDENWGHKIMVDLTKINSTNKKIYNTYSESDTKIKYLSFRFDNGTVLNNFTVQLMLTDTVDTEYEQYGESPSLDYRSEIKCCGDNVNLFDGLVSENNKRISTDTGGTYTANGFSVSQYIEIEKSNYIINTNYPSYYACYDIDKKYIAGGEFRSNLPIKIINSNTKYMRFDFKTDEKNSIKLEKGSIATPYSKHGQGCVKVTKCNKNLFNKNDIVNKAYINSSGEIVSNDGQNYTNYISVVSNAMYTIHAENPLGTAPAVCFYDTNKKFISGFTYNNVKNLNFTTPEKCKYIRASVSNTNLETLQIEEGPATTYEQHEEQSYIIPTQQAFKSIGNIRDTFIKIDDKWYERHYCNRYIFTGKETASLQNSGKRIYVKSADNNNILKPINPYNQPNKYKQLLCNYLEAVTPNDTWGGTQGISYDIWQSSGNEGFGITINEFTTVEQYLNFFKEKYDEGIPFYVDYILETPSDIECTEEQNKILDELTNARTYKNVTNITTDSKAILSLDYAKDLETLLNNTQALAVSNASEGV